MDNTIETTLQDNWRSQFTENVTGTAFSLSLSKNMIRALCLARVYHEDKDLSRSRLAFLDFGQSVPSLRCLIQRGLVEHHDLKNSIPEGHPLRVNHRWYTLTPAGILVYNLCVHCGLIQADLMGVE